LLRLRARFTAYEGLVIRCIHDIQFGSWSTVASLAVKGGNLQSRFMNGKIFVSEGCDLLMKQAILVKE